MKERVKELLAYARKWAAEALQTWGASVALDPVEHAFSLALGVLLALVLSGLW